MRLIRLAVVLAVNLLAPGAAEVQEAPKVYRVGTLRQGLPPAPGSQPGVLQETLHKALHDLGYIEGRNIVFDHRYAEGKNERFSSLAAALVALKPDVVIAETTPAVIAAMHATATIPIVMVNVSDPVASGLVASLARPGGNVTGVADYGTEMQIKGVELLRTAVPKTKRLAALMSDNPVHAAQLKTVQDAARSLGLTVLPSIVKSLEEFEGAFASMKRGNADALIVFGGAPFGTPAQRDKLIELAAKAKLPTMYRGRWWVEAGGLLSYGGIALNRLSSVATYVDKILKGAKPGDLPIEQPTKFELVINMKTAKALGLTIPQTLLQRADQIIEQRVLDQRGQFLRAALGFAGLPRPSQDRALWALRTWLDSWSGIGDVAVLPSSGEAGLILAQTGRPDRILTDNSMPDIMGLEVVQRLKNDPATRRIPVVAY